MPKSFDNTHEKPAAPSRLTACVPRPSDACWSFSTMRDLLLHGTVVAVASDPRHCFSKAISNSIGRIKCRGVDGDAHAGRFVQHRFLAKKTQSVPTCVRCT
jgi:hypothetical protein